MVHISAETFFFFPYPGEDFVLPIETIDEARFHPIDRDKSMRADTDDGTRGWKRRNDAAARP